MHNIASQIENLYMNNSRNDMSETLTNLITESLVSEVITPERLLIEHVVLIIVLHANVGTEVGKLDDNIKFYKPKLMFIAENFKKCTNPNINVYNRKC